MLKQAVYLVGGMGTRLEDRTRHTPKPLLDVGGRPFLDYLLDEAARHGFTDILLLAGHLGDQIEARYGMREWRGARIRVLREPEPLGTGGALRFALPELAPFFLLGNGDTFFNINLRTITVRPQKNGVVMALRADADDTRYGRVKMEGGLVRGFHPSQEANGPINTGIVCLDRTVIQSLPAGQISLEAQFPTLAAEGYIRGELSDGYFIDIGVPQDFERVQRELPRQVRRPAIFFDRDGVLNEERGYVHRQADFSWMPGAKKAIRYCNDHGLFAFVVTNQAGVAHGHYDESAIGVLHGWVDEELARDGAHIDAYEYCPHHPAGKIARYTRTCDRRKPGPGMVRDLLAKWQIDASRSVLIGNNQSDLDAAEAAGIDGVFNDGDLLDVVKREIARRA